MPMNSEQLETLDLVRRGSICRIVHLQKALSYARTARKYRTSLESNGYTGEPPWFH